jgi:N-acetylneuraminic acid mutarotase
VVKLTRPYRQSINLIGEKYMLLAVLKSGSPHSLMAILFITAAAITSLLLSLNNYVFIPFSIELYSLVPSYSQEEKEEVQQQQQQLFWTSSTNIPEPTAEASAAVLNERIYIIAGLDADEETTDAVKVYDPKSDSWSNAAPLPIPLDHSAAAVYDSKIYVVGGFLEDRVPTDKLFIYDPHTDKWGEGEPLPEARGALTANFIDGILYAVGGIDSSHTPVATNYAYDPKTNTWLKKAPMPTARHHLASEVVDGKLYVMGGRLLGNGIQSHINEALSNFNDNEVYDPKKNSWNIVKQMPTKRSGLAAASINSSIYVFGGQGLNSALNDSEKYDLRTNEWTKEAPIPTARLGLEAVNYEDKIYVIGGKTEIGPEVSDAVEIFHVTK